MSNLKLANAWQPEDHITSKSMAWEIVANCQRIKPLGHSDGLTIRVADLTKQPQEYPDAKPRVQFIEKILEENSHLLDVEIIEHEYQDNDSLTTYHVVAKNGNPDGQAVINKIAKAPMTVIQEAYKQARDKGGTWLFIEPNILESHVPYIRIHSHGYSDEELGILGVAIASVDATASGVWCFDLGKNGKINDYATLDVDGVEGYEAILTILSEIPGRNRGQNFYGTDNSERGAEFDRNGILSLQAV